MSMECTWYRVDPIDPTVLNYYGYVMVMERFHLIKCNDGMLFNITWVGRGGVIGTLNIPIQYLKKVICSFFDQVV